MVTSEKHQKALLGGIERFVGFSHPDLITFVPKILMAFYQIDLIDEEVVTQWGTHVSKKFVDKDTSKKVRKASEPFLKVQYYFSSYLCFDAYVNCLFYLVAPRSGRRWRRRVDHVLLRPLIQLSMMKVVCSILSDKHIHMLCYIWSLYFISLFVRTLSTRLDSTPRHGILDKSSPALPTLANGELKWSLSLRSINCWRSIWRKDPIRFNNVAVPASPHVYVYSYICTSYIVMI